MKSRTMIWSWYFNPHPREGGDLVPTAFGGTMEVISIHTPAKGVTAVFFRNCAEITISIHTPAKGVTRFAVIRSCDFLYFNPHPREGGDPSNFIVFGIIRYFNPHPREGGDGKTGFFCNKSLTFQSTPPRRG